MSNEREDLLEKANELGLDFPTNVKTEKLKGLILDAETSGSTIVDPQASTDTKEATPNLRSRVNKRKVIAAARKAALKLHVVTITNKDNRENDVATTVPLDFENEFFGISRNVPLDVAVEIEQALIDIAEGTLMTLHKAEIINGRPTGNRVAVRVKKFAISYGKPAD